MVVTCQSSTANRELQAGAVFSAAPGWKVHWPATGTRITLFILVLEKGSALKL